jgi:hypothetical protein
MSDGMTEEELLYVIESTMLLMLRGIYALLLFHAGWFVLSFQYPFDFTWQGVVALLVVVTIFHTCVEKDKFQAPCDDINSEEVVM